MQAALKDIAYRVFANDSAFEHFIGWRRTVLKRGLLKRFGNQVLHGPLQGLRLDPAHSELPKFIGVYEHVLHDWLSGAIARGYETVLNIGCAEGYYAVGLARLLPRAAVLAFDIDPAQQANCRANAALNGVADRVVVAGRFDGTMFDSYRNQRTLVICDIEGGEVELLRPSCWPALRHMDLLVELHEEHMVAMADEFAARFAATHELAHIRRHDAADSPVLDDLFPAERDRVAAIYENRTGPTSWLGMIARG